MSARSGGRSISFEILTEEISGDDDVLSPRHVSRSDLYNVGDRPIGRKRKSKSSKKKKKAGTLEEPISLPELDRQKSFLGENRRCEDEIEFKVLESRSIVKSVCENEAVAPELGGSQVSCVSCVELRQRNVNGNVVDEAKEEATSTRESSAGQWRPESNGSVTKLEKEESLDWNRMMAVDPNFPLEVSSVEKSPLKYYIGEIYGGNSLRSTIAVGNKKK